MSKLKKLVLLIALFFTISIIAPSNIYANQYKTITYDINEDGSTKVTYDINLINDDTNTYITKYTLSTGLVDIRNVETKLENGTTLNYNVQVDSSGSNIEVSFPQPKNTQTELKWSLSFTSSDIITEVGKVKEIAIPGFIGDFDLTVILIVPNTFGEANYYSKKPDEISQLSQKKVYRYTSQEIRESGILLAFGDSQTYEFTYKYELKNESTNEKIRATVTLPPDYKNQKIYYENFDPQPNDGYRDYDGNYIAEYIVNPGENYEVLIQGKAILTNALTNTFEIADINVQKYLEEDTYWETTNPNILSLAEKLTKDLTTNQEKAKAIYDYVVNNLNYNQGALNDENRGRLGAVNVLQSKDNAICQEFTDLFVTLCRASGIPARMLAGYTTAEIGYDLPENTLHAWAEFYTEEDGWITVDPTWESTSEGFNFFGNVGLSHFVLSIRGIDSEDPPLVLSFVSTDDISDNLVINPVSTEITQSTEILVETDFPQDIQTITKNKGIIKITNNTNSILTGIEIIVETKENKLIIDTTSFEKTQAIFPGDTEEINVSIISNTIFTSFADTLTFNLQGELGENNIFSSEQTIQVNVETNKFIIYGFAGLSFIVAIGIVFTITVLGKKKKLEK